MKVKINNFTFNIEHDSDSSHPRKDSDNLGKMICFHMRLRLPNEDDSIDPNKYIGWDEMEAALLKKYRVVFPLYMLDHSGLMISTESFNNRWDSFQIGFICASAEDIRETYMVKRISKEILKRAEDTLKSEVSTYGSYLGGEVYYASVVNEVEGIDETCGGFIGDDHNTNGVVEFISQYADEKHVKLLQIAL